MQQFLKHFLRNYFQTTHATVIFTTRKDRILRILKGNKEDTIQIIEISCFMERKEQGLLPPFPTRSITPLYCSLLR